MTETLRHIALKGVESFEHKHRPDGEGFYCLKPESPDWLVCLMRRICTFNDTYIPDDHRYEFAHTSFEAILELDDEDEAREMVVDPIFASTPDYQVIDWLNSNLTRQSYVEEWVNDGGCNLTPFRLMDTLKGGLYLEMEEVYQSVYSTLERINKEGTWA